MVLECLLDMDGVLVDFQKDATKVWGINEDPYDIPDMPFSWWKHYGIPTQVFWQKCGYDFWANLDWHPEGMQILKIVEETFGKENVCLLTAPCPTRGCRDGKVDWVRKHMPEYESRMLMGEAKGFCTSLNRWLIDDANHNEETFKKKGGNFILVPRKWNRLRGKDAIPHLVDALTLIRRVITAN